MGADGFAFWLHGFVWGGWQWPGGSGPQCLIRVAEAPEWVLDGQVPQKEGQAAPWSGCMGWGVGVLRSGAPAPRPCREAGKTRDAASIHRCWPRGGRLGGHGAGEGAPVQAVPWPPWRPAPTAVALGWVPVSGLKSAPPAQACPGTWQRGPGINTGKLEGLPELTRSLQLQVKGMRERFVLRSGCAGAVGRQWAVSWGV